MTFSAVGECGGNDYLAQCLPVHRQKSGVSEDDAAQDQYLLPLENTLCGFAVSVPKLGAAPNLWDAVCEESKKVFVSSEVKSGAKFVIRSGNMPIASNGFDLHGIQLNFAPGTTFNISVYVTMMPYQDKIVPSVTNIDIFLSQPILAACNAILNPTLGEKIKWLFKTLTAENVLKLAVNAKVAEYNRKDAGALIKPEALSFDKVSIVPEKDNRRIPAVYLELRSKQYLSKGWGVFTFGTNREGCEEKYPDARPGEFLGDRAGDDECRAVQMGSLIRKAVLQWIFDLEQENYNRFSAIPSAGPILSLAAIVNLIFAKGIVQNSWDTIAAEQNLLGADYLLWRNNGGK